MGWIDGLPWGVSVFRDAASGRPYYVEHRTGVVSWECPSTATKPPPWRTMAAAAVAALAACVAIGSATSNVQRSGQPRQLPSKPYRARSIPVSATTSSLATETATALSSLDADELFNLLHRIGRDSGGLSISAGGARGVAPVRVHLANSVRLRERMRLDGYVKLQELGLADISTLALVIDHLEAAGLPPLFMLLYDETWTAVHRASAALEPVFGLRNIHDFFVFHVRPGAAGWPIHRDRSGGGVTDGGFDAARLPRSTTVWISLTDATPATSCIYALPAHADADYARGEDATDGDAIGRTLAASHQNVRALPAAAGEVLVWSHRLLHWGSRSPIDAPEARKSLAFTMASPAFERPSIAGPSTKSEGGDEGATGEALPPWEARLALVAYSLICYHHSQPVPPGVVSVLLGVLHNRTFADHLTDDALGAPCGGGGFARNLELATNVPGSRRTSGAEADRLAVSPHAEAVGEVVEYVADRLEP